MGLENRELTAGEKAILERLRKITAKLEGVTEVRDKFGHTTLKKGKQSLAILGLDANGKPSLGIKTDLTTQAALIKRGLFYRTPYVGQHGWVSVDGTVKELDWKIIEQLIADTFDAK